MPTGMSPASETLLIGAVGDLLFESTMQRQAARHKSYSESFADVFPYIRRPDIMFGNHEGTASFVESVPIGGSCERDKDGNLSCDLEFDDIDRGEQPLVYGHRSQNDRSVFYSGGPYLQFNYHPMLADNLAFSGFDVVSTSNNHCLDRGQLGLTHTIDNLEAAGVSHIGTRRTPEEDWYTIIDRAGWRTAWVACADGTNYQRNGRDRLRHLVLNCFSPEMIQLVTELSSDPSIHAVVAVVHWGSNPPTDDGGDEARAKGYSGLGLGGRGVVYQRQPDCSMRHFARELAEAGAVAVLGMHQHILQGWERYVTSFGRETVLIHSLGNFASHGGYLETKPPPAFLGRGYDSEEALLLRRTSVLLQLGLKWNEEKGWAESSCMSYIPLSRRLSDIGFVEDELTAKNVSTYEIHVVAPAGAGADSDVERAFVASKFGPIKHYSSGGGTEEAWEWEAELDEVGMYQETCRPLSNAPIANDAGSYLVPGLRHTNTDGSGSTTIPSDQCLKCEPADSPDGCRWCEFKAYRYCKGPPETKIYLGEKLPWDTCLSVAADNPDCSEFAYAGGEEGKCVCMRKDETCNLARSNKSQWTYIRKCGWDL